MERVYISETLRKTNWVIGGRAGAAAKLGLPRTTLLSRMQKLGIMREKRIPAMVPVSEGSKFARTVAAGL